MVVREILIFLFDFTCYDLVSLTIYLFWFWVFFFICAGLRKGLSCALFTFSVIAWLIKAIISVFHHSMFITALFFLHDAKAHGRPSTWLLPYFVSTSVASNFRSFLAGVPAVRRQDRLVV